MIIGITGYKRSGKDTAANLLHEHLGFMCWSFADKMREVCSEIFDIPLKYFIYSDLKDTILPKFGKTPREILIHVGTDGFVHIYESVWVDYVLKQIAKAPDGANHVISDVRSPLEHRKISELGGHVIRIERDGCVLGNDLKTTGLYSCGLDVVTIQNNGTHSKLLTELYKVINGAKSPVSPVSPHEFTK